MKNLKYILIAVIIMFIGINGVSAKEVEKTCQYFSDSLDASLTIYDDGTAQGGLITYNKNNTVVPSVFVGNWSDKKSIYSTNKKCPNYALVAYDGNVLNTKMFVSDDESELSGLGYGTNALIGTSTEYDPEGGKDHAEDIQNQLGLDKSCLYESDDKRTKLDIKFKDKFLIGLDVDISIAYFNNALPKANGATFANWSQKKQVYTQNKKCFDYGVIMYIRNAQAQIDENFYYFAESLQEAQEIYNQYSTNSDVKDIAIVSISSNIPSNNEGENDNPEYKYGCDIFGDTLVDIIRQIYGYFKWIIPVLIVILSMLDFVKVVGTGKDDDFKKAQNNLLKRVVMGVLFFLIPTLISLVINFSGITEQFENGDSIIEAVTCILK